MIFFTKYKKNTPKTEFQGVFRTLPTLCYFDQLSTSLSTSWRVFPNFV